MQALVLPLQGRRVPPVWAQQQHGAQRGADGADGQGPGVGLRHRCVQREANWSRHMHELMVTCSGSVRCHGHHAAGPVRFGHLHAHPLNQHLHHPCTMPQASATPTFSLPARWRPAQRSANLLPWAAEACLAACLAGPACGRHRRQPRRLTQCHSWPSRRHRQAKSRRRRQAKSRRRRQARSHHRRGHHRPSKSRSHHRRWWRAKSCSPWADPTSHSAVPLPPVSLCPPRTAVRRNATSPITLTCLCSTAMRRRPASRPATCHTAAMPPRRTLHAASDPLFFYMASPLPALAALLFFAAGSCCFPVSLPCSPYARSLPRLSCSAPPTHAPSRPCCTARLPPPSLSCSALPLQPSSQCCPPTSPLTSHLPHGITFVWTLSACTGRRDLVPCLACSLPAPLHITHDSQPNMTSKFSAAILCLMRLDRRCAGTVLHRLAVTIALTSPSKQACVSKRRCAGSSGGQHRWA